MGLWPLLPYRYDRSLLFFKWIKGLMQIHDRRYCAQCFKFLSYLLLVFGRLEWVSLVVCVFLYMLGLSNYTNII